jgi:hypothetical protein
MDDFLFLATTFQAAVLLRDHIDTLLDLLARRVRRQGTVFYLAIVPARFFLRELY